MTSLPTQLKPHASEAAGMPIRAAVTAVAEQSFFALVDDCENPAAEESADRWLLSVVRFDDGHSSGSLACWFPPDLAQTLFDSFSGREPSDPAPPDQIEDLVGEFSNMVCGDWLSRFLGQRAFYLSPPRVTRTLRPEASGTHRVWMKVNDRPLAIDWDMTQAARALPNG